MSVQKFIINKQSANYTIIPNCVLQGLKDAEALGLYCYLSSLPHEWVFYKSTMKDHFNIGIKKLNILLKVLDDHNLVIISQARDEEGRFSHFSMQVNDGNAFKIKDIVRKAKTVVTETVATEKRSYKDNKDKNNNTKKEILKTSYASDDARKNDNSLFDQFWEHYPKKKDKLRASKIWKRKKLDEKAKLILDDIKNRVTNDQQWKNTQYIPHPTNYLQGERWNDEKSLSKNTNIKSTVKWFGPGHPTWDSLHVH